MKLMILDSQIVGECPDDFDESGLPTGFTVVDYSGASTIDRLYFDDGKVKEIPDRPSDRHVWNGMEWVEVTEVVPIASENWDGLIEDLRGSSIWEKSFTAATRSIASNAAWTLLYGTLTGTRNIQDLVFAIGSLRASMKDDGGDFTKTQIKQLNKFLDNRGFAISQES